MLTTTSGSALLTPEQIDELLVTPVTREAVALDINVSTTVRTASRAFRVPVVNTDPSAAWVAEGAEIPLSDLAVTELTITPSKIAGQSVITSEMANDSSPAAVGEVADGIARDIARKIDAAFWGPGQGADAPAGLRALTGINTINAGASWANMDPFARAISAAKRVGATLSAFVASPADEELLSVLKESSTSNRPLLGTDPTSGTTARLQGVPLLVSEHVQAGVIWGLDSSRVRMVIRQDVELGSSDQALYTSDRVVVRGIMRLGWGFPHAASVQKINLTTP